MSDLIDRYLACWNEADPTTRRALVESVWTDDAEYVDPLVYVQGHEAIGNVIAEVQAQFPGLVFSLLGTPDTHHQQTRFSWGLGPEGEEPLVVGFDVAVIGPDGRISSTLGFLDRVPV